VELLLETLKLPQLWGVLVVAYFVGSIPFGLLLTKRFARTDVRAHGSGNIGATNVSRVAGKKVGALTLVLDACKGAVPVYAAYHLLEWPPGKGLLAAGLAGFVALCGHCFPVWLRFRGGKGVATGLGVTIALMPQVALVAVLAFAITFALTRMASLGSLAAAAAAIAMIVVIGPRDVTSLPVALCVLVIVLRHHENITRLVRRAELRV
jgi:glycerol-3-phosphate acyltransferase PlsY